MDQSVAPGERRAWNQEESAAHIGCARLADDEEDEEEGQSLELQGEGGRGSGKRPPSLCVCEGCKVEHREALLFHSIPTTLALISIHSTLLPLTARPLSHPVL